MNMETGEVLEDLEEIMDYILSYNTDNMSKIEASDEVKEIQDLRRKHWRTCSKTLVNFRKPSCGLCNAR